MKKSGQHGVFYTMPWVVDLMLDLVGYDPRNDIGGLRVVEPAAGDGSFVVPILERLIASCQRHGRDIRDCEDALTACDVDPIGIAQTRRHVQNELVRAGLSQSDATQLTEHWIRAGDYLLDGFQGQMADFVIGNPPYVRLEEIDAAAAATYRARYRTMIGRADLYIAFFEAALNQLKPNGVCAYICADRWMLNQYGAELRRLVTSGFAVETIIEMHGVDAFERGVSAYPAITVIRRGEQSSAVVARAAAGIESAGSALVRAVLTLARAKGQAIDRQAGLSAVRVDSWFDAGKPWPCYSPQRLSLLKHLEATFYPLESAGTATAVGIGVATGADDLFITGDDNVVEQSRLLPLALAADTTSGHLVWSRHFLINPWEGRGLAPLEKFPQLKSYLESHEARLRERHIGKRNLAGWYRTIDRVDHTLVTKHKLYIPDIKDRLNPVLDRGETYPHHNLYFVQSLTWDHEVLGGLLLSDVAQFFIECYAVRMRGGYLRFQAQYLRRIRVPRPHDVTDTHSAQLKEAFRCRDREYATSVALKVYGIDLLPSVNT